MKRRTKEFIFKKFAMIRHATVCQLTLASLYFGSYFLASSMVS